MRQRGGPIAPAVSRWEISLLAILLAALAGVLASVAWRTGVTVDEPAHLLAAHLYWMGEDNLYPGDMPPAIKIVGGWVSHLFPLPIPYDQEKLWASQDEWGIAGVMMDRLQAPLLQRVFFYSRLPLIVFPLLTCVVLWWWARRLFSPRAAILLALLFCLSPTVLGHGALFKNDLAASFGYVLFWYRAWVYWQAPGRASAVWLGMGLFAAVVAKLSLLILVPIALLLVVVRHCTLSLRSWRALSIHLALVALVFYAGIAAAWQFRIGVVSSVDIQNWEAKPNIPRWIPTAAHALRVIPTPPRLRQGAISLVESNADGPGVYLLGEVYPGGDPFYFLIALATKVSMPLQILTFAAFVLLALDLGRRRIGIPDYFWIAPPLLYFTLASLSSLQLGVRLILPALVFFVLWCGRPIELLLRRRATAVVLGVLLTWLAARSAFQYPHYIAYFNSLAGGSDKGIRYLSDSNLDWGQDLRSLADYLRRNSIPRIKLAYFGNDNPYAYIPEERFERIAPPWSADLVSGPRLDPAPGYYAISATLLTGQLFETRFRDYFKVFREATPIGKAGYSIFIYKVP